MLLRCALLLPLSLVLACGSGTTAGLADSGVGGDGDPLSDGGVAPPPVPDDMLATATGCDGVFNPGQLLDYHLEMAPGDYQSVLADLTYAAYYPALFRCGNEGAISVGVRRKRSGGAQKVGLKIDFNHVVAGQEYRGLKKFSMENGVSSGDNSDGASVGAYASEFLAWRMMVLSGAVSGRAAFANIFVNGDLIGVYVNVEQLDKRFLKARLGDDTGWLYKKSGGVNDGLKTHEIDGLDDPYDDYFCFFIKGGGSCALPDDLETSLPLNLDIDQFLTMSAVNAIMANSDAPIFKDNNYYWYDWDQKRLYLPWDLDTVMNGDLNVFTGGVGGQVTLYTDAAFAHWEGRYDEILTALLEGPLTLAIITAEINQAEAVAGAAFEADPFVTGTMSGAAEQLRTYWTGRHAAVVGQVAGH